METLSFYVNLSLVTGSKSAILCWNKHLKSIASSGEANEFVQEAKQAYYYEHSAHHTCARPSGLPGQGQGCGSMLTFTQTRCSSPCPRISALPRPPQAAALNSLSQGFYSTVTIVNILHKKATTPKGNEKIRQGSLVKEPGISLGPKYQILWSPEFGIFISFLFVLRWIQQYRRGG